MTEPLGRKCLFCGGSPVTKEHAIPQWIDSLFPDEVTRHVTIRGDGPAENRGIRAGIAGIEVKKYCKQCNSGWMSALETTAKQIIGPLALGQGTLLNQQSQLTVARWVLKTCLTLSSADSNYRIVPESLYALFFETREPTAFHRIMIGGYTGEDINSFFHLEPIEIMPPSGQIESSVNGHLATILVGHFIGQVFYAPARCNFIPPAIMPQISPYISDFIWPRGLVVAEHIIHLARRFPEHPQST